MLLPCFFVPVVESSSARLNEHDGLLAAGMAGLTGGAATPIIASHRHLNATGSHLVACGASDSTDDCGQRLANALAGTEAVLELEDGTTSGELSSLAGVLGSAMTGSDGLCAQSRWIVNTIEATQACPTKARLGTKKKAPPVLHCAASCT